MRTSRLAVVLAVAAVACQKAETPQQAEARMASEAASARTAIEAQNAKWAAYIAAGQADSVAMLYTAGARLMPPNAPAAVGREAITAVYTGMMGLGTWHIDLHADSVLANGPIAIEIGTWTAHFTPSASAPPGIDTTDAGKYLVRWVQEDGVWKFAWDIWNSDKALPMPPAPARRRG